MTSANTGRRPWSPAKRVAFRFAFAYSALYCGALIPSLFPGTEQLAELYEAKLWGWLVPWVGKNVLHISTDIVLRPTGSGDTMFLYVQFLCYLVLAGLAALVWSALARRRTEHAKLFEGMHIYLRYALGAIMLSYGLAKVLKTQFPFPGPDRMITAYGESSPMGLLWTFMGYSTPYNIFTGGAEVAGGLLLFFRRTTTLGALIIAAVMVNVAMLNFCYDVPVKLFSVHLVLAALFLILPARLRLAGMLLLNRSTAPAPIPGTSLFESTWMRLARGPAKALLLVAILGAAAKGGWEAYTQYGPGMPRHALYGLYEVEAFVRDGTEAPPLVTDKARWRAVAVNRYGVVTIKFMDDTSKRFRSEDDPPNGALKLKPIPEGAEPIPLKYARPAQERLELEGTFDGVKLAVRLKKADESKYLLVNRGFHWVNEFPLNR